MNRLSALRKVSLYAYKKRRFRRVSIWLRKQYARHPREVIITDFDGDLKFKCLLHLHIGSQIFWNGSYSHSQLLLLDRILRPDMVYLDVGANVGEQTVFAAKRLTRGRVIAFEPTTAMYQSLTENISLNGFRNVKAVKLGMGDKPASLPIFVDDDIAPDGTVNEGVPTLFPSQSRSRLLETVDIVRLDDYAPQIQLDRLDVMKIDVEGAEMAVLLGGERTIRQLMPLIILEVHEGTSQSAGHTAGALLDLVTTYGYRVEGLLKNGDTQSFDPSELAKFRDVVCYPSKLSER